MITCTKCGNMITANDRFCMRCGAASNNEPVVTIQSEAGKLNLKRLAQLIMIGGLLIFSFGGLILATNLPVSDSSPPKELDIKSGDFYANLSKEGLRGQRVMLENMAREERRGQAIQIMLFGAATAVVGIVVVASIKKK